MKSEHREDEMDQAMTICDGLLALSQAQRQAIEEDDVNRLNQLLDERNRLIASLDLTRPRIDGGSEGGSAKSNISEKESAIMEKLRQLLHLDEENRKALQTRLLELRDQLLAVHRGRQVLNQYAYLKPQPQPAYIDRRR